MGEYSSYSPHTRQGCGGCILSNPKLKVPSPDQISIFGREWEYSWQLKTQSPTFWPTFHFQGGRGVFLASQEWALLVKWAKSSGSLACSCIADSLSHTTCVETNTYCSVLFWINFALKQYSLNWLISLPSLIQVLLKWFTMIYTQNLMLIYAPVICPISPLHFAKTQFSHRAGERISWNLFTWLIFHLRRFCVHF